MIRNTTRINEKHAKALAAIRLKTPAILAYRIALVAFGLIMFVSGAGLASGFEGFIWMVCGALCVVTGAWGMKALLKSRITKAASLNQVSTYVIKEDGISATVSGDGISGNDSVTYDVFDRQVVGKDGLYLRIKQTKQFLVIDSEGFTEGTADEAARLIESKGIKTIWSYQ